MTTETKTATVNHTAAEAFLRGAGIGVRECVGVGWLGPVSYTMVSDGFRGRVPGFSDALHARLPAGQYTLQYREGMTLAAAEAWDYLAADVARRCDDKHGDTWRVIDGAAQCLEEDDWTEGVSHRLPVGTPYTVAPDAPGESGACVRCFPLRCDCDGKPLTGMAAQLAAAQKRVAELEEAVSTESLKRFRASNKVGERDEMARAVADALGCCPSQEEMLRVAAQYAKEHVEWNKLEAERDAGTTDLTKARADLDAAQGRYQARINDAERERDAARAEMGKAEARAKELKECCDSWEGLFDTEKKRRKRAEAKSRETDKALFTCEAELAALRAAAVTLPDDTTTPLTLTQRAMALEMGRRHVLVDGSVVRQNGDLYDERLGNGTWLGLDDGSPTLVQLLDPTVTVTLCPEPAPEPRRLTFAEAVALTKTSKPGIVAETTAGDFALKATGGGACVLKRTHVGLILVDLTPEMFAAEWVAK